VWLAEATACTESWGCRVLLVHRVYLLLLLLLLLYSLALLVLLVRLVLLTACVVGQTVLEVQAARVALVLL